MAGPLAGLMADPVSMAVPTAMAAWAVSAEPEAPEQMASTGSGSYLVAATLGPGAELPRAQAA